MIITTIFLIFVGVYLFIMGLTLLLSLGGLRRYKVPKELERNIKVWYNRWYR